MSIPGQIIFIFVADVIHMGESTIGVLFVVAYLVVSFIQVRIVSSYQIYHSQPNVLTFHSIAGLSSIIYRSRTNPRNVEVES